MEIKITSKQILQLLHILSWIIFVGLCIEAGGILFNTIYVFYKPAVVKQFWNGADLSALYAYDHGHFVVQASLMCIAGIMKALIFYLIITLFYEKKLSMERPFSAAVTGSIFNIAYLCLGTGIFSSWGANYAAHMKERGIAMPDIQDLRIGGADVWFFMAVILFVIGHVFKKGTELQTENDLTV